MKLFLIVFSLIFFLFIKATCGQEQHDTNEFTFMFYNVENFFDCENDPLTNDDEFTPGGNRRWTQGRFHSKTERIAKTILAAGKWNAPIFVGLCEIENLVVLESLVKMAPLSNYGYKIIHKDSPDERGIDVALIYRPELFNPFDFRSISVNDSSDVNFKTRDILQIDGVLYNCDTLHVFVNHWPSRYGGLMETKNYRKLAAEQLKISVKQVESLYPKAKILCMGDFNDTPTDESIVNVLGAKENCDVIPSGEMINLSQKWLSNSVQTIKSQYTWDAFDQFIVSDYLLNKNQCFRFVGSEVFDAPFLLEPDIKFGGLKPKRTYAGFKYQEGFSDHLPVLLWVEFLNH